MPNTGIIFFGSSPPRSPSSCKRFSPSLIPFLRFHLYAHCPYSRPRTIAFVWEYLIHALDALHVKKVDMDDQQIFNMYLEALPAPPFKELGFNSLGAFAVDTILGGRCFEYNRTKGGETVVSIHQLNPHMFLNRPGLQDHRLPYRILQRPFWVSYYGTDFVCASRV